MKKVVNITIGGIVFNVEEDAYRALADYLDSIGEYLKKDADKEEIIADIEVSIAEKLNAGKRVVGAAISLREVEEIIEEMGSVENFKEFVEEEMEEEDGEKVRVLDRKLYRDVDDKIIAGVCSGVAAYFGIETVIVRLVFFVSVFFGGVGAVIYLFLWLVVAPAITTAQKLQMRGERITLKEIEKAVKSGVDSIKKKDFKVFQKAGEIVKKIVAFLGGLAGIVLILASIAGVFALSFGMAWILSGANIPYTDLVLRDFLNVSNSLFALFNFALYCGVFLPLIILFTLGLSAVKRRFVLSGGVLLFLLVLWFAALGFLGSVIFQNIDLIQAQVEAASEQHRQLQLDHQDQN